MYKPQRRPARVEEKVAVVIDNEIGAELDLLENLKHLLKSARVLRK